MVLYKRKKHRILSADGILWKSKLKNAKVIFLKGYNTNMTIEEYKSLYFIGIGGISMSGLAEILIDRGFKVSGSDNNPSKLTQKLSDMGAVIRTPQSADNVSSDIDVVVYTAAIHPAPLPPPGKNRLISSHYCGMINLT